MQWEEEVKTGGRYKVAYLNPARIYQTAHSFLMTGELKAKIDAAKSKSKKNSIREAEHKKARHAVAAYISQFIRSRPDKDYFYAPYGFE